MLRTNSAIALVAGLVAAPALAQTYTYSDIDADGNLELSNVEFEGYSNGLFDRFDADADGFLSEEEFVLLEDEVGPFGADEPFEAFDAEPDGLLAADEFNAGLYGVYDANSDLRVDETEFGAYEAGDETVGGPDNQVTAGEIIPITDWGYDALYTDGLSVEALLDADVIDTTGEDIGDVENVLFGVDGELLSVVVEVGGFLDIGDTHLNVPWSMVEAAARDADGIMIPIVEEDIDDYGLFETATVLAGEEVGEVSGDGIGTVETGPRVWRAPELIGDYARLRDGDGVVNYGYVEDIIVRDGQIGAVLVTPDRGVGVTGDRAYPFYGYGYGYDPGREFYDLPYDRTEIEGLETFDDGRLLD